MPQKIEGDVSAVHHKYNYDVLGERNDQTVGLFFFTIFTLSVITIIVSAAVIT